MASTKMTRKGQVTIPAEIRQKLNLSEGELFVVNEVDGKVVLESQRQIARQLVGAFAAYVIHPPPTKDELHEAFADAIVEEYFESERDE
jgi:AbrB family looped-hinge helix DNA binding protein